MKYATLLFAIALAAGTAVPAFAGNLLVNGDFEQGRAGFMSAYSCSPGNLWNTGSYDVVLNPHLDHRLGGSFEDHTTGAGYMLALNGASDSKAIVWSETVTVSPDTTYLFTGWGASWGDTGHSFDPAPAELRILINGRQCGVDVRLAATNGLWESFAVLWHSGASTQAVIELHDRDTAWLGNDFALDDLSLVPLSADTATFASQQTLPSAVNTSSQVWSPQTVPLPRDNAFGYALPAEVGLPLRIEASTDLLHWFQATNVAFYFKDFDSTNFNQRFYRFQKE